MSSYDAFAWLYDRYWAAPLQKWEMPALERLVLNDLPPSARILDVCCGTGHLARELVQRGFRVTGIDNSSGMLEIARTKVPQGAEFLQRDATDFEVASPVDATLCTFDSINHIMDPAHVLEAFRRIRKALKPGGRLVFDVNTPSAYGEHWEKTATVIEPDHAFFLRGGFDAVIDRGHTEITIFKLHEGAWIRSDARFLQRPWQVPHLTALLEQAGFTSVESWRAEEDLAMSGHYGQGRCYIRGVAAVNGQRSVY